MVDRLTKEQRSRNMSRIRSKGTQPERRLFNLLHELFPSKTIIEHPKELPGCPDAWLPEFGIAVFADGCFFHGCPKHGHIPYENQDYWKAKIKRNRKRAKVANKALLDQGIQPIRIWEHQLQKDLRIAKRKLNHAIKISNSDYQDALDDILRIDNELINDK